MVTETYTVVACPYSWKPVGVDEGDPTFHVSLFVAPRLIPDGDRGRLDEFELFVRWGRLLPDLHLELADQQGLLEARPVTARFEPALWEQMFPGDTPVVGNGVPTDWAESPFDWRSFDARAVADLATHHQVIAAVSSLVDLPAASESPLFEALREDLAPGFEDGREPSGTRVPRPGPTWNELKLTQYLDEVTAGLRPDVVPRERARGALTALKQLHRLRRFYERQESAQEYRRTPDLDATTKPLPSPEPEFHERVTAAGDHPDLLRALGLVVDLEVADLDRLRRATRLSGRILVEPTDRRGRSVTVAVRGIADGALVTVPSSDDWSDGMLRVGDASSYAVLDHDVDGSGLKTERFAATLPRLVLADPRSRTQAAPPALRASGLTLVRTDQALRVMRRVEVQVGAQQRLDSGLFGDLLMHTEDVMRGLRVEVWDDTAKTWHGLHERLTTLDVDGTAVLTGEPTVGFLQGTAITRTVGVEDSPRYVHEAVFGWEGWSLSAERPGRRIRFDHDADQQLNPGHEVVEESVALPGEKPPHPFTASHVARPRSLPRLRYGRAYAFRLFGVDLAGNSRPLPPRALRRLLDTDAQLRRQLSTASPAGPVLDPALAGLRGAAARVAVRRATTQPVPATSPRASVSRRATLSRLSNAVVSDVATPLVRETRGTSAEVLSDLVASAASDLGLAGTIADAVAQALATTTRLTPFLRWDPVAPPVVVPRRRFTEGESQRVLVIRSGVRQDPDTLEVTVSTPGSYAGEVSADEPALGYHADCQRHLVPPKTTQMTAELHGMFDAAVGKSSSAAKQKMLTWSLAEEGSLLDVERPDLDVPGGRLPQEGVSLAANDPTVVPASLPLAPGEAPPTGQYVVHDIDRLTTPYLPDPLAAGISVVFPEAVEGIGLTGHDATEGFTTEYGGKWPKVQPIRLDLVGRQVLDAERKGRTLTVALPAGDLQRLRLSSSLRAADLDLLAVWRKLPSALTTDTGVAEAAKDGWLWSLTPYDDVLLVHAVPRPVQAPRVHFDTVVRLPGQTSAGLVAELRVHGSSTQSVTAEATWTEHLDDLVVPTQPQHRPSAAIGFTVPVDEHDTTLALRVTDVPLGADMEHLPSRLARHQFPDTKHRRVTYTFRATTRFREYFHPSLTVPDPAVPGDDGLSVVSAPLEVSIPSSARPAAPVVHSVVPLFRWSSGTEAEQPMGWRHERSTGVRIYLERPWFSSGEGELLAVLLATGGDDDFGNDPEQPDSDQSGYPFVSKIGADPIWDAPAVENRAVVDLQLASMLVREHADGVVRPGRPVAVRSGLRLPATGDAVGPLVTAAAYRPQFNSERGLWYVDVAIDPWAHVAGRKAGDRSQEAFWPFLRLAVARYQPESIAGHHLSAPVRCRYVQLPPTRTTSVDRTDERSVRIVVSGTIGTLGPQRIPGHDPNRVVIATLARRDPDVPTDLGWTTVASSPLVVKGNLGAWDVAWVGELTSPDAFRLRRPSPPGGGAPDWRVTVEEWERFAGDPPLAGDPGSGAPIWEQRLVYADEFLL